MALINFPKVDNSKLDDMHFNGNKISSYNKKKNIVIGPREDGKSTWFWLHSYRKFLKGRTTIVFKYQQADITDVFISDTENLLNKFLTEPIKLDYKRGSVKDGLVDIYAKYGDESYLFFRVIAISIPLRRLKSLMLPNLSLMMFDEFLIDTRHGEKYPNGCEFKMNEIFKTFVRESSDLKMYFLGNPYSLHCWVFSWCRINISKLYPGSFYVNEDTALEVRKLDERLKAYILERDKDYIFDDSYTKYAFDGRNVNDESIQILEKCPTNYTLRYVFLIEGKKLCIYKRNEIDLENSYYYWIGIDNSYNSKRRNALCFDYNQLQNGSVLFDKTQKKKFYMLKWCFQNRRIQYKSVTESYLFEEIYEYL